MENEISEALCSARSWTKGGCLREIRRLQKYPKLNIQNQKGEIGHQCQIIGSARGLACEYWTTYYFSMGQLDAELVLEAPIFKFILCPVIP